MNIFFTYDDELSRSAFLIEQLVRKNSDIRVCVLEKTADLVINLDFTHSTGKNTLHCVLYDRDELKKNISVEIANACRDRNIPLDFAKIDNRITTPEKSTLYVKFGRQNYEFDEATWTAAVAEGIISGINGTSAKVEAINNYKPPTAQKTYWERNFAQEPTRNSDLFKAQ
jgi:hypothetical protein